MILKRLLANLILFCSFFFIPWYIVFFLFILFSFYFNFFIEAIFYSIFLDILFSRDLKTFYDFPFLITVIVILSLLCVFFLKDKMLFYEK